MPREKNILPLLKNNHRIYKCGIIVGMGVFILLLALYFYDKSKRINISVDDGVTVATHYNGADATIMQLTDHYYPNTYDKFQNDSRKNAAAYGEFLAFKHNIPLHIFEEYDSWSEFEEFLKTGRGGASAYYPSCNKNYRKVKLNALIRIIKKKYRRTPTTISYGCGKTEYVEELPSYILGGRNSNASFFKFKQDANTWYGENCGNRLNVDFKETKNIINRPAGGRFYKEIAEYGVSVKEASVYVKEQVKETVKTNGFYTNFMHWHDYYPNKEGETIEGVKVMPYLFEALEQGVQSSKNAKIDYNEAIEYLYAKETVDSIFLTKSIITGYRLTILLKKERPVDYSVIKTPITLIISKKFIEKLGKKSIVNNHSNLLQDVDNFYVNVLLDFNKYANEIDLDFSDKEESIDYSFQRPKLKKQDKNIITSSLASKFVLFRRKKNAMKYEIEIVDRAFNYLKEYRFDDFEDEYDYFCGAINKQRESSLIAL